MVSNKDNDQRTIPVPREISEKYILWLLATGADRKLTALMTALLATDRYFFASNPELEEVFEEPESADVEKVAWYKAMMLLYLLEYLKLSDLKEAKVPLLSEEPVENPMKGKQPDRAVAMGMDVLTIVGKTKESLSIEDHPERTILHKLSRQVTEEMSDEQVRQLIHKDKAEREQFFKESFWTRFRVGVSVVSSDLALSNTAGLEFDVEFSGFPQEVIDDAYASDKVLKVGPRLNLAALVETHPECVKNVWVRQIAVDPEPRESVQKGKGTKKIRKLPRVKFSYVRAAVVDGVLPEAMYKELFTGRSEQQLLRTRSNINMI